MARSPLIREQVRVAGRVPGESARTALRWDDFIYLVDLYERSAVPQVTLADAELDVDDHVATMADYALERGLDVRLCTRGVMGPAQRERIAAVWGKHPQRRFHAIVTIRQADPVTPEEREARDAFLSLAGARAGLSFVIEQPDFDLDETLRTIARFGLSPTLLLEVRSPRSDHRAADRSPSDRSQAELPAVYPAIARTLATQLSRLRQAGVTPMLDPALPTCMFTDAELGGLLKLGASFGFEHAPTIDIGADLALWPTLASPAGASPAGGSLYDFDDLTQVGEHFRVQSAGRPAGMLAICGSCDLRARSLCHGGVREHEVRT